MLRVFTSSLSFPPYNDNLPACQLTSCMLLRHELQQVLGSPLLDMGS